MNKSPSVGNKPGDAQPEKKLEYHRRPMMQWRHRLADNERRRGSTTAVLEALGAVAAGKS
jgi:hypothetical protein